MNQINMMRLAVQLKPIHDFVQQFQHDNTYPNNLDVVAKTSDKEITLQHLVNLAEIYDKLVE